MSVRSKGHRDVHVDGAEAGQGRRMLTVDIGTETTPHFAAIEPNCSGSGAITDADILTPQARFFCLAQTAPGSRRDGSLRKYIS